MDPESGVIGALEVRPVSNPLSAAQRLYACCHRFSTRRGRASRSTLGVQPSSATVRRFRPLARRRLSTIRPFLVDIRTRNPCVFFRRRTFGWYVRFPFIPGPVRRHVGAGQSPTSVRPLWRWATKSSIYIRAAPGRIFNTSRRSSGVSTLPQLSNSLIRGPFVWGFGRDPRQERAGRAVPAWARSPSGRTSCAVSVLHSRVAVSGHKAGGGGLVRWLPPRFPQLWKRLWKSGASQLSCAESARFSKVLVPAKGPAPGCERRLSVCTRRFTRWGPELQGESPVSWSFQR